MGAILTQQALERGERYLLTQGRPLEQALHRHAFDSAPREEVLQAMAPFQRADGGYGGGLEPDLACDASSVIETARALQLHRRVGTPSDHPQVRSAVRYLLDSYWPDRRIWPIRPTTSPDVPAAPWWKARDLEELIARFGGCLLNPRAEVLACLLEHRSLVPDGFIEPLVREVVDLAMAQPDAIEMHDLWCYTALGQSPGLDETLRRPLMEKLCRAAGVTVERDQSKWGGYCLKPLMLVRDPRSPFLAAVGQDLIEANIAYEIGRQTPAGSWEPHWDWGGQHPEVWERAKAAWTSILTEETLFVLRNFGRTPSAA